MNVALSDTPPADAVIVTVPGCHPTAVPSELTAAIVEFEDDQVVVLAGKEFPSASVTLAVNVCAEPKASTRPTFGLTLIDAAVC